MAEGQEQTFPLDLYSPPHECFPLPSVSIRHSLRWAMGTCQSSAEFFKREKEDWASVAGLVKHLLFQSISETSEVLVSKKAFLDFSNYCVDVSNEKENGNVSAGNG